MGLRAGATLRALALAATVLPARAQQLSATPIASGLFEPVAVRAAPHDVHRLFVLERAGRIRIIRDGVLLATPFLDITNEVSTYGEGGLLGLAFHPDYAHNGRFFVSLVEFPSWNPTMREYRVSANPDVADSTAVEVIFRPYLFAYQVHYASDLQFGPDGMLYYTVGTGGPVSAQGSGYYYGKMLRFDIDVPPPHVPLDNPYVAPSDPGLDWIWASGLRNPYRFSFDRLTGDLFIADVGGAQMEEVDFQPNSFGSPGSAAYGGGRDYGWICMEGTLCLPNTPTCTCDPSGATLTLPAFEYPHAGGAPAAIIGGYVYRGSAITGLQGSYFYADFVSNQVWTFAISQGHATQIQDRTVELHAGAGAALTNISSFGEDANGELYAVSLSNGSVFRIDPVAQACVAPVRFCTTTPNSAGSGAVIDSCGPASVAHGEFTLTVAHCPPHVPGMFYYGDQHAQAPFGNGVRCVGGQLVRTATVVTDAHGCARRAFNALSAGLVANDTRDFQFVYRNTVAGGALFNASDALGVVFCP